VVVPVLLGAVGQGRLAFPFIAVTVGAFLLALAPVLSTPYHVAAGAALCLLPVVAVLNTTGSGATLLTGLVGGSLLLTVSAANLHRAGRLHAQDLKLRGLR
jgi:hypothetical protein